MSEGQDFRCNKDWKARDVVREAVKTLGRNRVEEVFGKGFIGKVFLPGGLILGETMPLEEFYCEVPCGKRRIYIVFCHSVAEDLLQAQASGELCNCKKEKEILLGSVCGATKVGYTRIACFLGYVDHGGEGAEVLENALTKFTGFAPLLVSYDAVCRHRRERHNLDIVVITSCLHALCRHVVDGVNAGDLFDYVLHVSCLLATKSRDAIKSKVELIDPKSEVNAGDPMNKFVCRNTDERGVYGFWNGDFQVNEHRENLGHMKMDDLLRIFDHHVAFKPFSPLSLRLCTSATILGPQTGPTKLFTSIDMEKEATASKINVIDPETGMSSCEDIEEIAKKIEAINLELSIDGSQVKQLVGVTFDTSGTMSIDFNETESRLDVARRCMALFAKRLYEWRVPCVLTLRAFANRVEKMAELSCLVPNFEEGLRQLRAGGRTALWRCIREAAKEIVATGNNYKNAAKRILVISDGANHDPSFPDPRPWEIINYCNENKVTCDSVVIARDEDCSEICAFCHLTGGVSFRPKTLQEFDSLFETEAFLNIAQRKVPRRTDDVSEATFAEAKASAVFDTVVENQVRSGAMSDKPLTTPKWMIYACRDNEHEKRRIRRILAELHQAAVIGDKEYDAVNPVTGVRTPGYYYDDELVIYPMRERLDQWQVYLKGPSGSLYEGKWWYIYVTFPDNYPNLPPSFRFISVPYHLNITRDGRVCWNVIDRGYLPQMCVVQMLQNLRGLLFIPEERSAVNSSVLELYKHNHPEYERLARESCANAKDSVEAWTDGREIYSNIEDATFTVGVCESAMPDYLRSGISGGLIPLDQRVRVHGVIHNRQELIRAIESSDGRITCPITGLPITMDDILEAD